jgi:flavin reductase ActVB
VHSDVPRSRETLTEALSRFASGVTVVTARDSTGKAHGYTATAFSAVSLDPPLVLSCLARSATCFPVFSAAEKFCVNVLSAGDREYATHFATRMDDKFLDHEFTPGYCGIPSIASAVSVFGCDVEEVYPAGDHVIIVGRVAASTVAAGEPLLYYRRQFRGLSALSREPAAAAPPAVARPARSAC